MRGRTACATAMLVATGPLASCGSGLEPSPPLLEVDTKAHYYEPVWHAGYWANYAGESRSAVHQVAVP